jgi:AcrR family transcriptional regulator
MEPLPQPPTPPPLETRETRNRLLDEAERLFAERGFEATSVRDITAAAGANLAAVNYHFGGKDKLYREVFRRRLTAVKEQREAAVHAAAERPHVTLEHLVRSFTEAVLAPFVDVREGVRVTQLVVREFADPHLEDPLCAESFAGYEAELVSLLRRTAPGLTEEAARLGLLWLYGITWQIVFEVKKTPGLNACPGLGCSYQQAIDHAVRFTCAGLRAASGKESPWQGE